MCMQDLAINRAITWRPMQAIQAQPSGWWAIPPNVNRVAIIACIGSTSTTTALRVAPSNAAPAVNVIRDIFGAGLYAVGIVTIDTVPGLPGLTLYSDVVLAEPSVWEAVIDPTLGRVVSEVFAEFGTAIGGRRER